jgi:hypothetical protein
VPSRYEFARELLNKWMVLGASAPIEREENIVKYVIHPILDDVPRANEGVCTPRAWGSENAQA